MVKEELVDKLRAFNLSPNQAKVYGYLCQFDKASVSDISEVTHIYAQDIYKTVKELEKKGLVLKSKTQPLIIEAIPVDKSLLTLIKLTEFNYKKEVDLLKKYYKEILTENKKGHMNIKSQKDSKDTLIVCEKEVPESRFDVAFDNLKEEFDVILVQNLLDYRNLSADYYKLKCKEIAKKGIKMRFLFLGEAISRSRIEATKRDLLTNNYEIRTVAIKDFNTFPSFALIDFNELWLRVPSTGRENATIVTNVKEIVGIAKYQFEVLWNDHSAKIVAKSLTN